MRTYNLCMCILTSLSFYSFTGHCTPYIAANSYIEFLNHDGSAIAHSLWGTCFADNEVANKTQRHQYYNCQRYTTSCTSVMDTYSIRGLDSANITKNFKYIPPGSTYWRMKTRDGRGYWEVRNNGLTINPAPYLRENPDIYVCSDGAGEYGNPVELPEDDDYVYDRAEVEYTLITGANNTTKKLKAKLLQVYKKNTTGTPNLTFLQDKLICNSTTDECSVDTQAHWELVGGFGDKIINATLSYSNDSCWVYWKPNGVWEEMNLLEKYPVEITKKPTYMDFRFSTERKYGEHQLCTIPFTLTLK
ncbi:TPA: hypothetical protein JLR26_004748 [Escherichia coli]|nr:hypothetical protein [Escherichia coli]